MQDCAESRQYLMSQSNHPPNRAHNEPGNSITKRELIVATWEALDCESIGAGELEQIQFEVARRFGEAAVDSPASIARLLADEGAELRHPEILEFDVQWRERRLPRSANHRFDFGSFAAAIESCARLENSRRELLENGEDQNLRSLREFVIASKADCLLRADSYVFEERQRAEAKEIASWLGVWLRTPALFADWLELRRASAQFRKRFEE